MPAFTGNKPDRHFGALFIGHFPADECSMALYGLRYWKKSSGTSPDSNARKEKRAPFKDARRKTALTAAS
jgi:hypothetical protein